MASKKAGGSTTNGRKSIAKRLGIKVSGGAFVKKGAIIIRQRGSEFHPGTLVGMGKDYTIFAMSDGIVKFSTGARGRRFVGVEGV